MEVKAAKFYNNTAKRKKKQRKHMVLSTTSVFITKAM